MCMYVEELLHNHNNRPATNQPSTSATWCSDGTRALRGQRGMGTPTQSVMPPSAFNQTNYHSASSSCL